MTEAQIRRACLDDKDDEAECMRLVDASRGKAYRGLMPESALRALPVIETSATTRDVWILTESNLFRAICACGPSNAADGTERVAEIDALYVHPQAQGRGLGRRLAQHATGALERRGFEEVRLWCLRENHAARAFYERIGYRALPIELTVTLAGVALVHFRMGRALGTNRPGAT